MLILISTLQVLNAMLVGGIGWYFAHHQRRIAEAKLHLNLLDKRFAIFDAARRFIGRVIVTGGPGH